MSDEKRRGEIERENRLLRTIDEAVGEHARRYNETHNPNEKREAQWITDTWSALSVFDEPARIMMENDKSGRERIGALEYVRHGIRNVIQF